MQVRAQASSCQSGVNCVVRGEHGDAADPQGGEHRPVLARHRFHGGHEFLVLALGVVHQRHRGPGDAGQVRDFARMVHAQFQHGDAVFGTQPQQLQRQPDVVVQVALRGQRRIRLPGAQDGSDHLRHGGLAVAAGHRDQGQAELGAPARSQRRRAPACCRRPRCREAPPAAGRDGRSRPPRPWPAPRASRSLASKRSPFNATNRSPGCSVRVSLCTRCTATARHRRRPAHRRESRPGPRPG